MRRLMRRHQTVPVPVGVVAELRAAVTDLDEAVTEPGIAEARDDVLAVARALLDEVPS